MDMLHMKFGQIPLDGLVAISKKTHEERTGERMDERTHTKVKVPHFRSGPKKKCWLLAYK
jgi:hypothetical protein